MHPGPLEHRNGIFAFVERERFGERHPVKRRVPPIAQPLRGLARLRGQHRDEPVGRLWTAHACELLPNQPVLTLERGQHAGHRGHGLRRREQPQRVPGGRGVDDNQVVVPFNRGTQSPRSPPGNSFSGSVACFAGFACPLREPRDLEDADELVDAGDGEIEQRVDVVSIQPGAVLEDLAERAPMFFQPSRERARRVELDGVERTVPQPHHPTRRRRQAFAQRIAERMRRVGGDDQHAAAGGRLGDGSGRRARRFADAALAAIEHKQRLGISD
jgi:hypothetical protein